MGRRSLVDARCLVWELFQLACTKIYRYGSSKCLVLNVVSGLAGEVANALDVTRFNNQIRSRSLVGAEILVSRLLS